MYNSLRRPGDWVGRRNCVTKSAKKSAREPLSAMFNISYQQMVSSLSWAAKRRSLLMSSLSSLLRAGYFIVGSVVTPATSSFDHGHGTTGTAPHSQRPQTTEAGQGPYATTHTSTANPTSSPTSEFAITTSATSTAYFHFRKVENERCGNKTSRKCSSGLILQKPTSFHIS